MAFGRLPDDFVFQIKRSQFLPLTIGIIPECFLGGVFLPMSLPAMEFFGNYVRVGEL